MIKSKLLTDDSYHWMRNLASVIFRQSEFNANRDQTVVTMSVRRVCPFGKMEDEQVQLEIQLEKHFHSIHARTRRMHASLILSPSDAQALVLAATTTWEPEDGN